jgi:pilus assembly protein CpaF
MADGKIITFRSSESSGGPCLLPDELACAWAEEGQTVIFFKEGEPNLSEDPASWVPRFKNLSPLLLRNYLADAQGAYARLTFPRLPPEPLLKDLLTLVKPAFRWVLVTGFQDSTENIVLLDASDLLLWEASPAPDLVKRWTQMLQHLADLHLPQCLARVVLQGEPVAALEPLEILPEVGGSGLKRREGVRRLARRLAEETTLYRGREKVLSQKSDQDYMIEQIKNQVHPQLLQALDPGRAGSTAQTAPVEAAMAQKAIEACLAGDVNVGGSREERGRMVTRIMEEVLGLGPLEPLLKDPDVSEIMVISKDTVYIEKKGKLHLADARFTSDSQLRTVIDRIVAPIGRRVDESSPLCDARLLDGSRVNIVLPPLALDGPSVTIRKFPAKKLGLDELVQFRSMTPEMAEFLRKSVLSHKNIVVAGGTGSGKTTLLNALSSAIPDDERIVTIEDAAELKLQKPHVVRLESRPPNTEGEGAIPIRRLVINALRMRPDRIVVGECRGGEALDMLQAMNTGHDGSLTTVHANSPRDALGRLETLVLMAGMDLPLKVVREQIRSAVHLIVQQARLSDGARKVVSITEVTGMEGDLLTIQELFRYAHGAFEATGIQSAKGEGRFA